LTIPQEIKSTLELALEKAAKLPRLTEEEIREQREKEYGPRARAAAGRFLAGEVTGEELVVDVLKYGNEEGEVFRKAFLESILEDVLFEEPGKTARAIEGIRVVLEDDYREEANRCLQAVLCDYEAEKQRVLAELEKSESTRVRALGISGSAIRLNLRENEEWRQRDSELREAFEPKLDQVKQQLARHLVRSSH